MVDVCLSVCCSLSIFDNFKTFGPGLHPRRRTGWFSWCFHPCMVPWLPWLPWCRYCRQPGRGNCRLRWLSWHGLRLHLLNLRLHRLGCLLHLHLLRLDLWLQFHLLGLLWLRLLWLPLLQPWKQDNMPPTLICGSMRRRQNHS